MTRETWLLISDLHLDARATDRRGTDQAVTRFTQEIVERLPRVARLVLLGDTFELTTRWSGDPATRAAEAVVRVEQLAHRFEAVFAAWRELVLAGHQLHVVSGNHDAELAMPAVERRLRELIAPDGVTVHPWVLHRPGLLYAEHGHQHHSLSRNPDLLVLTLEDQPAVRPVPEPVDTPRSAGSLSEVRGAVRALVRNREPERRAGRPAYLDLIAETARREQLPPQVLARIHAMSARGPLAAGGAAVRRAAGRRLGRGTHDGFLVASARRIDELLRESSSQSACYAFGHTHVPALTRLGPGTGCYANAGTWSSQVRGGDETEGFPYVEVSLDGSGPQVRLRHWSDAQPVTAG